jgi:hypothetical protein
MKLTEKDIAQIIDTFKASALEPHIWWNLEQAQESDTPDIAEIHGDVLTRIVNLETVLKTGPERESWITSKLDNRDAVVTFPVSRLVVDPERFQDDSVELILAEKVRFWPTVERVLRLFLRRIWRSNRDVILTRKEL